MLLKIVVLVFFTIFLLYFVIAHVFFGNVYYYLDYASIIFETEDSPLYDFIVDYEDQVYDFIVVGGGSAGAVITNRLSKNHKVLLLEAGGDPPYPTTIPGLALEMLHRPSVDWMHKTIPQKYSSQAMIDKVSLWPRGKVLGGSSVLNFMLYVRGNPHCFENWVKITGDSTWSYENVLPYFKKSLDYHGQYQDDEKNYGNTPYGPFHVEKRLWTPTHEYFFEAGKELGLDRVDLNGPQRSGMGLLEVNQKQGMRFGTYSAFIETALHRKNLHIFRYSLATKIKLDKNRRAIGVYYTRHGKKRFARVSKTVIVSAGSVESPKLLMMSGIGPYDKLKSIGIKPKVNLPVGKNLKDHVAILLPPFIINESISFIADRDMGFQSLIDYYFRGYGPLTCPIAAHSQAFFTTSAVKKLGIDWPDIQLYYGAFGVHQSIDSDFAKGFGVKADILKAVFDPIKGKDAIMLSPVLVRPHSVGELTLKDKNPLTPPIINPKYLKDFRDVTALIDAIKFTIKLVEETKSFKRLNAKMSDIPFPGCEHLKVRSDKYWECYIRKWAISLYHPVGTCSMGKGPEDPKGVVDSRLKVINTIGLIVADASVMPEIVNGNTNAPCIMIGEKASDFIREHWSQQYLVCTDFEVFTKEYNKKCYYTKLI